MVPNVAGEKANTVEHFRFRPVVGLSSVVLAIVFSTCLAFMVTIFLLGRSNPLQATKPWIATLLLVFVVSCLWQVAFLIRLLRQPADRMRHALNLGITLLAGLSIVTAAVDASLYLSDVVNNSVTVDPAFRGSFSVVIIIALYTLFRLEQLILVSDSGGHLGRALILQLSDHSSVAVLLAATLVGILAGTSYVTAIGDDYSRYWAIADALGGGWGYPASEVGRVYQAGGMSSYLVDLPGLPLGMLISFALLGHSVFAAMLPTLLGGSIFALLMYLALRELTADILLSFIIAIAFSLFPLFSFYVLRASEPDAIFVSLLVGLAFLAGRCDDKPNQLWAWIAFGVVAGVAALTRPEGIAYMGLSFLTLGLAHRTHRGFWVAVAISAALLGVFSTVMLLTFGVPWPTSFTGVTKLDNITQNLDGLARYAIPRYSAALATPSSVLEVMFGALLLLYGAGSWILARHRPALLFLSFAPAIGLAVFLLVSPALTRPQQPYDFFRRASYALPSVVLTASYPLALVRRWLSRHHLEQVSLLLILCLSVFVVSYEDKLWAEPEETYDLRTQILTSGLYIQATDLVEHPYPLPKMSFEWDGHAMVVAKTFDYMGFRSKLTAYFAPMDLHGSNRARGYPSAALVIFLVGLCYAVAARTTIPREHASGRSPTSGRGGAG